MSPRILLVDDDPAVLTSLRRALVLEQCDVLTAEDGESALVLAADQQPDLIILDIMLPGLDGLSVCERLRKASTTPVLMLTARDTVPDRVAGFDPGADDYLVKPFALDELLARMRALLRRSQPPTVQSLHYADISLNEATREAHRGGKALRLSRHELELLGVFLRHPREVLSREQLCVQVWGYAFDGESNFVDVAVKELRKKLEEHGHPRVIQTVRGYGYALREG
jgi:two-component system response regulator MprA